MTKRTRIILALITGVITVALAHQISFAFAETITDDDTRSALCDGTSRAAYEDARTEASVEQTPAYLLSIAEDFLTECATPLHVQAVSKHAARAALDAGATDRALAHFERALDTGAALSEAEQLDYILALWLNDRTEQAWSLRDDLIADWLAKAASRADITSTRVRDGVIHKVTFDPPFGTVEPRTHWLAQPHGEGWPAAISLETDPALVSLMTFRMGPKAQEMRDVTLVQCRGRKTAARSFGPIDAMVAEQTAFETLKAYLRQPQSPRIEADGQPAESCFASEKMFLPVR